MGNKRIVATAPIEKIAIDILEQIVPVEITVKLLLKAMAEKGLFLIHEGCLIKAGYG